jgi:hypothetical protein
VDLLTNLLDPRGYHPEPSLAEAEPLQELEITGRVRRLSDNPMVKNMPESGDISPLEQRERSSSVGDTSPTKIDVNVLHQSLRNASYFDKRKHEKLKPGRLLSLIVYYCNSSSNSSLPPALVALQLLISLFFSSLSFIALQLFLTLFLSLLSSHCSSSSLYFSHVHRLSHCDSSTLSLPLSSLCSFSSISFLTFVVYCIAILSQTLLSLLL